MPFTVLTSIYSKENPLYFEESMISVFSQTLCADEVVLVEDGPLTQPLYEVVAKWKHLHPEIKIVKLDQNMGLGKALNEGLKHCSNDLVVRVDTDDICKGNRFATQVAFMYEHPEIDVCGAGIDEFENEIGNVVSARIPPETHIDLYKYGKRRNPINHPASVFRKKSVEKVGGYHHFSLFEDYYLWARMMVEGAKFHNIQETLLFFRRSPQMIKRRGGLKYAWVEIKFQYALYKIGYINILMMIENILIRFGVRIIPNAMRNLFYLLCLR